jgi:hypothetical protein
MKCTESSPRVTLAFNIMIHMCILFVVLSGIYFFFIKDISTGHYKDQVNTIAEDNLARVYYNLDPSAKEYLTIFFDSGITNRYETYIEESGNTIKQHNIWVQNICFSIIGILVFMIIGVYAIFRYARICIPIQHLLIENAVTFLFVGLVEVYFFLKVVIKYVPIAPSLLNQTIAETLKKELTTK